MVIYYLGFGFENLVEGTSFASAFTSSSMCSGWAGQDVATRAVGYCSNSALYGSVRVVVSAILPCVAPLVNASLTSAA